MNKYSGISVDPSYAREEVFLKRISGYAFKNTAAGMFIETNDGWCEVDPKTLSITSEDSDNKALL